MIEGLQQADRRRSVGEYVAVTVGGAVGAALRYEVWTWRASPRWLLMSTFGVNVFGCLVVGAALGYLWGRHAPVARAGLFGLACGFTTFGLYAFQAVTHRGAWNSVMYLVGTPVIALIAMALGAAITTPRSSSAR
ncbi:protein CrcB [Rhodococcus sp. 05-340-1]|uniref:fluoride efflux transporter FluC n=1 Tax=unclassified Rhodococcus (in: high G+C Gram-positive bacteria) TaxID=192944 RepID=UPI000B9B1506|nr:MULTISPECIES: CrcB family protein [unclassified Rhodococcus (in: high G+C Gram-positive bacteria)]OZD71017.1 protein CrcB [Rhodococcus sp. 05-340-2]OZD74178.1 protein CrcB [Rhodococcus sp. 05-340-1]